MDYFLLKNTVGWLAIVTFLSSLFFLFFPNRLRHLTLFFNKWFSLRRAMRPLEIPRNIEDAIYRRRTLFGILSLVSALSLISWYIRF